MPKKQLDFIVKEFGGTKNITDMFVDYIIDYINREMGRQVVERVKEGEPCILDK